MTLPAIIGDWTYGAVSDLIKAYVGPSWDFKSPHVSPELVGI